MTAFESLLERFGVTSLNRFQIEGFQQFDENEDSEQDNEKEDDPVGGGLKPETDFALHGVDGS